MLSRNTYLIPQVPSSHQVNLDGVELLLHQHPPHHHHHHHFQQEVFPGLYLAPALDNAALFNQGEPSSAAIHRKPTAKRDRHSKINTAQGPRDRRVRLSISIARKFFDLQEMLGFDKPSKTLDWLLTKSKAAIKELVQSKQNDSGSGKSSSSPCECELISSENGADSKRKTNGKDKGQCAVAKESRAKARARARERTLEKMCIKQFGGCGDNASDHLNPSFQCRNNQLEFLQLSAGNSSNMNVGNPHCEAATRDLIEESVVMKRKSKNPVFGLNSNYYMVPSASTNENWDVYGFASQSNLHAILDQHKFINSNSNI